jgi:hypothetical protein
MKKSSYLLTTRGPIFYFAPGPKKPGDCPAHDRTSHCQMHDMVRQHFFVKAQERPAKGATAPHSPPWLLGLTITSGFFIPKQRAGRPILPPSTPCFFRVIQRTEGRNNRRRV